MEYRFLTSVALFIHLASSSAIADDWPQFLGPRRDGVSRETGLNLDWKVKPPKVLWKVPLGSGYSSLAVVGERVYTMAQQGDRDFIFCLDARTGNQIWKHDAAPTYVDVQRHGAGPRATPTYHDGKVFCLMPMGELLCLNAEDGKLRWQVDTFKEAGAKNPVGGTFYWGISVSPLVEGDVVVVQPGGTKDGSVVAFHTDTGRKVWGVGADPVGYASAIAITVDGQRTLICPTGQSILGIDPQGKLLWRYEFGNRFNATCATPVWVNKLLVVSAAYGTGGAVLEIIRKGEEWEVKEKWRKKDLQNLFATSMIHEGHIYGCHGDIGAILIRCLDLQTGDVKWSQRVQGRASLLQLEGHLISLSERGGLQLIEASPNGWKLMAELPDVLTFKSWAAPALADGRLYIRDEKHVVCVDLR